MSNRSSLERRYFFLGAFTILSGCRRGASSIRSHSQRPRVSVIRAASYTYDLRRAISDIFDQHRLDVVSKKVVIKPNLVEFSKDTPINTNPALVAAVIEELRSRGAGDVRIAEGPGHRRTTPGSRSLGWLLRGDPKFRENLH